MASGKEIKARIKSIKNTGKITKAMELISTVKMKKAQESVVSLRPFALAALDILSQISHTEDVLGVYGKAPVATRELIILVAAQKGLCGGYNVNVFKKATEYIRDDIDTPYTREYDYITIGKRSRDFILRTGQSLVADFSDEIRDPITVAESRRMVRFAISEWETGKYSKVSIIYNHYVSAITQLAVVKPLFPINRASIESFLQNAVGMAPSRHPDIAYTIEPDATTIVEHTIPMILDAMIHETLLEARASEHAARMIAMKNAKDSANKK
jgi:F-type H+-transporting ATPase subunit gamma